MLPGLLWTITSHNSFDLYGVVIPIALVNIAKLSFVFDEIVRELSMLSRDTIVKAQGYC